MNAVLWVVQVLLAVVFTVAATTKLLRTREQLLTQLRWVEGFTEGQVRGIAVAELLGVLGLVVPGVTGVLTWLTPLAAAGLALDMAGAVATHARLGEWGFLAATSVLCALCVLVAWGRFGPYPL